MNALKRTATRPLLVLALGLVGVLLPAVPAAQAAAAPWDWKRVTVPVNVSPTTSYTIRALCPSGYTAITGGLALPERSSVSTQGQYRTDDGAGSGWTVQFKNFSTSSGTATVVAECVETADLPPISYQIQTFNRGSNGYASGEVACPNPGEAVLTGGVDWDYYSGDRSIRTSMPGWGETSWYGEGYNPTSGSKLGVEVYCVDPAYLPGFQKIESTSGVSDWTTDTITCPVGKRILNGGTVEGYASYPTLNKWTSTSYWGTTTRAMCVTAGSPTISLSYTSPGPNGGYSSEEYASFSYSGYDPAGFPNSYRCSLDGAPPSTCGSNAGYGGLSPGQHQFLVWNTTADGRSSNVASFSWTIDQTPPTVTPPKLPKAILGTSAKVKWTATDQGAGVDHYEAAYQLFHADGTSAGWTKPPEWMLLTTPEVRTPDLAQGESICLSVRGIDKVANVSGWSTPVCTARPFDDRALTAGTGWGRITGSSYWLNTATQTTAAPETMQRNAVTSSRVGLVVTRCPGCGRVSVKVGATVVGRIDLDAASLAHRRIVLLPAFTPTTAAVTVKTLSTGQQVTIDGLVAIQSTATGPPA